MRIAKTVLEHTRKLYNALHDQGRSECFSTGILYSLLTTGSLFQMILRHIQGAQILNTPYLTG